MKSSNEIVDAARDKARLMRCLDIISSQQIIVRGKARGGMLEIGSSVFKFLQKSSEVKQKRRLINVQIVREPKRFL